MVRVLQQATDRTGNWTAYAVNETKRDRSTDTICRTRNDMIRRPRNQPGGASRIAGVVSPVSIRVSLAIRRGSKPPLSCASAPHGGCLGDRRSAVRIRASRPLQRACRPPPDRALSRPFVVPGGHFHLLRGQGTHRSQIEHLCANQGRSGPVTHGSCVISCVTTPRRRLRGAAVGIRLTHGGGSARPPSCTDHLVNGEDVDAAC